MIPVITIDGPSGAGKGTVCRQVAIATAYHLLDSGALYRLTALSCIKQGVDLGLESATALLAASLDVEFDVKEQSTAILLDGVDVTQTIREERVGMAASTIATYPMVRSALLERQRNFARSPGLVADGRDMGTVVFPDAMVKIYLTASAEERASRRMLQLIESESIAAAPKVDKDSTGQLSGDKQKYDRRYNKILADIIARDEQDMNRVSAPLKPAADAYLIDSTGLNIKEVVALVMEQVQLKAPS